MPSLVDRGVTTPKLSGLRPRGACLIGYLCLAVSLSAQYPADNETVIASATSGFYMSTPVASGSGFVNAGRVAAEEPKVSDNEAAAVDLCLDYVEAQYKYLQSDYAGDGIPVFAQKIRSTPGKRDGLYWPIRAGDDESPAGPNVVAAAAAEPDPAGEPRPISGYFLKVLLAQGPSAPGGARDYRVNNRLTGGFALLVWPAQYGVSGLRSFVVNHLGEVYARDLGPDTNRIAAGIAQFDPNHEWAKVAVREDSK